MRSWLIKLILWLLYGYEPKLGEKEVKKIEDWLISLTGTDSGFKPYYTIRKRVITESMTLGLESKEYWVNCGRIMELKQLKNKAEETLLKKDAEDKKK